MQELYIFDLRQTRNPGPATPALQPRPCNPGP